MPSIVEKTRQVELGRTHGTEKEGRADWHLAILTLPQLGQAGGGLAQKGSMIAAASTFKSAFALLETTPRRCACLSPVVPGAACRLCAICFLCSQLVGDLAAVLRELLHHLLVQPDIHRRGIVRVTAIVEFGSKLFARREARSRD